MCFMIYIYTQNDILYLLFSSLHLPAVCFTAAHLSRGEWRHPVAEIHYWCQSAQIPTPRSAAIRGVWSLACLDKWSSSHQLMSAQVNSSQFIWTHDAQGQFKYQSEYCTGLYMCLHEWMSMYCEFWMFVSVISLSSLWTLKWVSFCL